MPGNVVVRCAEECLRRWDVVNKFWKLGCGKGFFMCRAGFACHVLGSEYTNFAGLSGYELARKWQVYCGAILRGAYS